jgi:hypothetical protein
VRRFGLIGLLVLSACAQTTVRPSSARVASKRHSLSARARAAAPTSGDGASAQTTEDAPSPANAEATRAETAKASGAPSAGGARDEHALGSALAGASAPLPKAQTNAEKSHPGDRKVQVAGIEGTLANFDVRVTMEGKAREFGRCHAPRLQRLPALAGSVEFKIHVHGDGHVGNVAVANSDLGDRELERCFTEVILATPFPKPRGGDANVSYTMLLEASHKGREPELWETDRVRHVMSRNAHDIRESCDLRSLRHFKATVYVNRNGRVVSAGVAGKGDHENGTYDCIAEALHKLPMPKAKKKSLAKVSFAMNDAG